MISAHQHGIFPRSEALVSATRDLDRGRTTPEAVSGQQARDLADFVALQESAGMDHLSDGLLTWQDLFRPLVEAATGLKAGPMVRWFDNNAFYRAPEVTGEISIAGAPEAMRRTKAGIDGPRVATLPSPLLFSRVAHADGDRNRLMQDLSARLLRPVAEDLAKDGVAVIQLQEPWLVYHGIEASEWSAFEKSIATIADGLKAKVVLHTYFGDAAPWADRLRALPVAAVGIDFVETDVEALGKGWEVGILAGCLDGRNSLVESADAIVEFVDRLAGALSPPAIHLSSNSDLEFLPQTVAAEKVKRLGEAARILKERSS